MKKVTEIQLSEACTDKHVQILECGGVHLEKGQTMLVLSSVAERMVKQYRGKLASGSEREVEKLGGGHYMVLGQKETTTLGTQKKAAKAATPAKVEQPAAEEGETSDRSMGTSDGKAKSKSKSKKKKG